MRRYFELRSKQCRSCEYLRRIISDRTNSKGKSHMWWLVPRMAPVSSFLPVCWCLPATRKCNLIPFSPLGSPSLGLALATLLNCLRMRQEYHSGITEARSYRVVQVLPAPIRYLSQDAPPLIPDTMPWEAQGPHGDVLFNKPSWAPNPQPASVATYLRGRLGCPVQSQSIPGCNPSKIRPSWAQPTPALGEAIIKCYEKPPPFWGNLLHSRRQPEHPRALLSLPPAHLALLIPSHFSTQTFFPQRNLPDNPHPRCWGTFPYVLIETYTFPA